VTHDIPTIDLAAQAAPHSISPTDVSQFIRLDQCQRYLRLRLHERRNGRDFMTNANVAAQSIPPILTRSGMTFESNVEREIATRFPVTKFSADLRSASGTTHDNAAVAGIARSLADGEATVLLQARIQAPIGDWLLRGDVDLMRMERAANGRLQILIADMKSSTASRVEHRLQVAFYHDMLAHALGEAGVAHDPISLGILYRGAAGDSTQDGQDAETEDQRGAALELLGTDAALLDMIQDAPAYLSSVQDLVLGQNSTARRLLGTRFEEIPFHLAYKCDGCLYNEFCLRNAAETDDLSLLPHLAEGDKRALQRRNVRTISGLATLKDLRREGKVSIDGEMRENLTLVPAVGQEELARDLSTTWPVGPRLDELIHRARRYRSFKGDEIEDISWIPGKGYTSLPASNATLHPNLVRVYIDVQHDYLNDRLYLLGALVTGNELGQQVASRRRSVLRLAEGPPESNEAEETLLREWVRDTLAAVAEVVAPDAEGELRAPIHLVFINDFAQRLLLDAFGRHATSILGATALYDFVTQMAAFDSPVASHLDTQIREHRNYPMVCQSLQSVATFLKFNWNDGSPYRDLFRHRMFDYIGRLDSDVPGSSGKVDWYTSRSRFNSQIPLEYAYAAWNDLPAPEDGKADEFDAYRAVSASDLVGFHARRLEAMEHVARDFPGNRQTTHTSFTMPDLAAFDERAPTLAHALDEFVMIERHVELGGWKNDRYAAPEQRLLRGQTLLVRYLEEDQPEELAALNREHHERAALREQQAADFWARKPDARKLSLTKAERELSNWSNEGTVYRLRIEVPGDIGDLDAALRMSTIKEGARLVLSPRFTFDERLPEAERTPFTPTARQMLYQPRVTLKKIAIERKDSKAIRAFAEVEMNGSRGGSGMKGFAFGSRLRPLDAGELYTLDDDPNDFNGYWASKVTEGLIAGGWNRLHDFLLDAQWPEIAVPPASIDAQQRFLDGLEAMHAVGAFGVSFEQSKRRFISGNTASPVLLVQGPPGTGKSFSTAFALFARIQAAMAGNRDYRIVISCKTHAAIDVLLHNVRDVHEDLRRMAQSQPELFERYFDARLLEVPLFRNRPRGTVQPGITAIPKDEELEKGEQKAVDRIESRRWAVVASTPGGIYGLVKDHWSSKELFGHEFIQAVVLDEASQMNLPEAIMAALPLASDGQLIVVGDHRQMPPIVKNDWSNEPRRTFQEFRTYESLFLTLLALDPPLIQFEESFRLHADMAEFLREQIYVKDRINFRSNKHDVIDKVDSGDSFISAVLNPEHPLTVIVHDESESQLSNPYELRLMAPILAELAAPDRLNLDVHDGMGVVVPHRAQRAAFVEQVRAISKRDDDDEIVDSAVDTVERFQGGERTVILIGATESDRDYLLAAGKFLLDPRRLTVALSRAKKKLVLVAARSVFELFSADEETFANAQLWKNLLRQTCTVPLWDGDRHDVHVEVWGNPSGQTPGNLVEPPA
jgi:hypothetical protein